MDGKKCHRKTPKNHSKPVKFLTVRNMKLVIPIAVTSILPKPLTQIESKNEFSKIHPNEMKVGIAILNKVAFGFSIISPIFAL